MTLEQYLETLLALEGALREHGAVVAGEAAAHAHLASATGWARGKRAEYLALVPRRIAVLGATAPAGTELDTGPVAAVLRDKLELFTARPVVAGHALPTLCREATLAELLSLGGLRVGLAGILLRVANDPPIDPDDVRDILKAARQPEPFQPLLELLALG